VEIEAAGNGNSFSYRDEVSRGIGHPGLWRRIPSRIEDESQNLGTVKNGELTHCRPERLLHFGCLYAGRPALLYNILGVGFAVFNSKGGKSVYRLIDTHVHLNEIENLDQAIEEAKSASIMAIIGVGSDYESDQKILDLARLYSGFLYPALGLHPWNLKGSEVERNIEFIEAHIDRAVAIGEIGLDYHKRVRAVAEKDLQKYALKEVLKMAKRYNKPAIIHSRYAWRDALDLVEEAQLEKVVFHWYTGTSSVLRDIVSHGYYISASPAVEYHEEHRRAVREIPLARLLLETDSPVVYRRGSEFEYESKPADILRTLRGVAGLRGVSEAQIAEVTTDNALRFFCLQN
jgi:TatD DNase family protein